MLSDREEGEIDSEEDSLRRRICELEAENVEYEKMRISEGFTNGYDLYTYERFNAWELQRAGQVPTDASSISSAEFPSPKKRRRKRFKKENTKDSKHLQNKYHFHHEPREKRHKNVSGDCKKSIAPRRSSSSNKNVIETILLDSSDSNEYEKYNYSIAAMNLDSEEDDGNVVLPLSREELRLALVRNPSDSTTKSICPLKERLRKEKEINIDLNQCNEYLTEDKAKVNNSSVNVSPEVTDNSMSLEEQELRLIALRSAIMKKHLTRKKRNAEVAYSPTDFEQFVIDPLRSVETDLEDLDKELDSPVSSPNLSLSPLQYDEDHISIVSLDSVVNPGENKSIDMDIVTSESENETHSLYRVNNENIFLQHSDIPLPNGPNLNEANIPMVYNYAPSLNHTTPIPFEICVAEGNFKSQEEFPLSLLPPIMKITSPQFLKITDSSEKEFTAAKEPSGIINLLDDKLKKVGLNSSLLSKTESTQIVQTSQQCLNESDQVSDEEEKALRALLLSQRQNMRNSRHISSASYQATNISPHLKPNELKKSVVKIQQSFNDTGKSCPSESILKEAVRRFKVKTNALDNLNPILDTTFNSKYSLSPSVKISSETKIKDIYNNDTEVVKKQLLVSKGTDNCKFSPQNIAGINKNKVLSKKQLIKEYDYFNLKQSENKGLQLITTTNCSKEVDTTNTLKETRNVQRMRNVANEQKVKLRKNEESEKISNISILKPKVTNVKAESETKLPQVQKGTTSAKNISKKMNLLKAVKQITRPIKIIKPNKVINTSIGFKRNVNLTNEQFSKSSDLMGINSKSVTTSRVINAANIPEIKVNKLVINLNDSESSSDEEFSHNEKLEKFVYSASARTDTPEPLTTVLNENYYKITNTNIASIEGTSEHRKENFQIYTIAKKNEFSDSFEKKLEIYLKTVRSTVQQKNTIDRPKLQKISACNEATPTAVRSLPIASQEEYKRLVHRMKLLEEQKQLKKLHKGISTSSEILNESSSKNKMVNTLSCKSTIYPSIEEAFLVEEKNFTSKEQQLEAYETSFTTISNCVISNLNKSLRLVTEAKKAKIAKMRCTQRLKELRQEIDNTQCKLKEEQEKIARIYPEICSTNETITKLNRKKSYMFESAIKLGKSIKGNDYRLNNDFKREITLKTKGLATDIKLVNSIKYCDLDLLEKELKITNKADWDTYNCDHISNRAYAEEIKSIIEAENAKHNYIENKDHNSKSRNNAVISVKEINNTQSTSLLSEPVTSQNDKEILDSQNKNSKETTLENFHQNVKVKEGSINQREFTDKENPSVFKGKGSLCKYVSPLRHLKSESGQWDPNGVICPYELMGQCEDKDCSYIHLCDKNSA